jgi:hypothetical protein
MMRDAPPGWYPVDAVAQVFLLAAPDDPETLLLDEPVTNTIKAASGRGFAYTLGTRYTTTAALSKQPTTTTELLEYERSA